MTGYQLEATNREQHHIKVRGDVIYMDPAAAEAMLDVLQKTECDMAWHMVLVNVQLERV